MENKFDEVFFAILKNIMSFIRSYFVYVGIAVVGLGISLPIYVLFFPSTPEGWTSFDNLTRLYFGKYMFYVPIIIFLLESITLKIYKKSDELKVVMILHTILLTLILIAMIILSIILRGFSFDNIGGASIIYAFFASFMIFISRFNHVKIEI
ncbi:hypothetical protein C0585_02855 [Candidatus Woesearchaeota archaeon]|nr:MAG: hypothetical protein C0585_02855 [Candidatus Woesearchaeota archaeon]